MAHDQAHPDETPLCLNCLAEVSPFAHVCLRCGHSCGQFTPFMPLEGARFFGEYVGEVWNRLWFGDRFSIGHRMVCVIGLAATVPWLFLYAPLTIWQIARRGRGVDPRGIRLL